MGPPTKDSSATGSTGTEFSAAGSGMDLAAGEAGNGSCGIGSSDICSSVTVLLSSLVGLSGLGGSLSIRVKSGIRGWEGTSGDSGPVDRFSSSTGGNDGESGRGVEDGDNGCSITGARGAGDALAETSGVGPLETSPIVKDARKRSSRLDFWVGSRATPEVGVLGEVPGLAERGEVERPVKSSEADRECDSCGLPDVSLSRLRRGCGANVSTACRN
ncbi:hypothetical protein DFS33DRAFT_429030 [Desarmillaria ectypa]|nr:hypothetical protein DFS33DRAFT_429030 [Desarmillaria ectypa]